MTAWRELEADVLDEELERRLLAASEVLGEATRRSLEIAGEVFDVAFTAFEPETELPKEGRFAFYDWQMRVPRRPFDALFPGRLLQRARYFAVQQLDMHAGRSRHDFITRVDRHLDQFVAEYRAAFEATVTAIESAWSASTTARAACESALQFQRVRLAEVGERIGRIES